MAEQNYVTPEVTSTSDAYIQYQIVTDGLFVLDVDLSDEGEIQRIAALRDPGSMLALQKPLCVPGNSGQHPRKAGRRLLA